MTVEEILHRIVRAHLAMIVICVLLAVSAAAVLEVRTPAAFVAQVRLQTLSTAPTSPTEADALSSGVLALATSPPVVRTALQEIGAPSSPAIAADVATHDVSARRLGESAIVELTVTGEDSASAARLATALAGQVVDFLNSATRQAYVSELAMVDARNAKATRRVDRLRTRLLKARGLRDRENLTALLAAAQGSLTQIESERADLVLSDVNRDVVTPVDVREPTVEHVPSTMVPRLALGLLLGLLVGLTLAVARETLRPRLAGIRALARALDAPLLGSTSQTSAALANTLTLAARRQGVETLVIVGVDERDEKTAGQLLEAMPRVWDPELIAQEASEATQPLARGKVRTVGNNSAKVAGAARPPAALPWTLRFTNRFGVTSAEERSTGVVVVSVGSAALTDLDAVQDMLQALRWPVVGIVEVETHKVWSKK